MVRGIAESAGEWQAGGERFTVTPGSGPEASVLLLGGELDHDAAGTLREALAAAVAAGRPRILVDCADLLFCDSSGLNVILRARLAAREAGARIELSALRPTVARVFEITGADTVFTIHPTLDEALAQSS
ncbi:STAS domain-containing protein [Kitasatospora sp. NBC_01266]|uniref:STAS domain-containing protein n=1 Tax=Kitasatospora sp. NBC_01266 TaxID=2903572 RepID=UPI002E30DC95|nr:STAS domain-containing protein [Kitasatospora sp. NBC_01266]